MNMRIKNALFSGLVMPVLLFGVVSVGSVHAQQIVVNDSDIKEQSVIVQEKMVETLKEYVVYLQLVLIDHLEAKLSLLKARAEAR